MLTLLNIIYCSVSWFYNYYGLDFSCSLCSELRATMSDVVIA